MSRPLTLSLALADDAMPRTLYWERFTQALHSSYRFVEDPVKADIIFPYEDLAQETNWPRYGNPASAYLRGSPDLAAWENYLRRFVSLPKRLCVVNMHPMLRLPRLLNELKHVAVADICLTRWERALNPRTISMPALPITAGSGGSGGERALLASFRGVLSHPCRQELAKSHDGQRILVEMVDPSNHVGLIDAETKKSDATFERLMEQSHFAFVPRGDTLFSYRLAEALSFGAIPVVLSDGWVLPFDRVADWEAAGLHPTEAEGAKMGEILGAFPAARIATLAANARALWSARFSRLDVMIESMMREIDLIFAAEV